MRVFRHVVWLLFALQCQSPKTNATIDPEPHAELDAVAPSAQGLESPVEISVPPPAIVKRALVPKDSEASFVRASAGSTTRVVFMPGLCSNAYAYVLAFPEAARAHGGVVAIDGDAPCGAPDSGFRSFTWSATLQKSRIDKALAATGMSAPPDGFTLVGYSSGASIAEMVHQGWPELFPRLVIIAPPEDVAVARC